MSVAPRAKKRYQVGPNPEKGEQTTSVKAERPTRKLLRARRLIVGSTAAVPAVGMAAVVYETFVADVPAAYAEQGPCPDGSHVVPGSWDDLNADNIKQYNEVSCEYDTQPTNPPVDTDPDKDGIHGTSDQCPSQKETVNGYKDGDGCPDTVPAITNPPATNPPATNPPATNPPATNPPATAVPTTAAPETTLPLSEQDDDGDGEPNDTDKCASTSASEPVDANGCSVDQQDPDEDGVVTGIEKRFGTDPNNEDTDGDGKTDGEELLKADGVTVKTGKELDFDQDRIIDALESDDDPDCDGKSLETGDDIEGRVCQTAETDVAATDPTTPAESVCDDKCDSDGDDLDLAGENAKGTDPLDPDTDGDGIGDLEDPTIDTTNEDTDDDSKMILFFAGLGTLVLGAGGTYAWAKTRHEDDKPKEDNTLAPVRPQNNWPSPGVVGRSITDKR